MASLTAQLLVGHPDPYTDEIAPTHELSLWENDRPVWALSDLRAEERSPVIRWVPTLEHPIEDGLLLIGIHVLRDGPLALQVEALDLLGRNEALVLYDTTTPEQRTNLYALRRQIDSQYRYKIVATILHGSLARSDLGSLAEYTMAVEVCCTDFLRAYAGMSGSQTVIGEIPK